MEHLGLIGIGVMGGALALNLSQNGHDVSMLDRTSSKMEKVVNESKTDAHIGTLSAYLDVQEFVQSLPIPRAILVLVPSGVPLRSVINSLIPFLEEGDLVADLGNSNWQDTEAHSKNLSEIGLAYLGVGISGGAEGARRGPSIMAGGTEEAWARIAIPLKNASAKFEDFPCCDWFGPGGSGHFIKMVHNGIEYAFMQLIAEAYGMMRDGFEMSAQEIGAIFEDWSEGPLRSYLIEIAAEVALAKDPDTGRPMLDVILDTAGQKGTGRWSVIEGLHLAAPISIITGSVEARNISAETDVRKNGEQIFGPGYRAIREDRAIFLNDLKAAMLAGKIMAYGQGFEILSRASEEHGWNLGLAAISRVWRAGCIIRSGLLDQFAAIFEADAKADLAFTDAFLEEMRAGTESLTRIVPKAISAGHPIPSFSAALSYHNARRSGRVTANMIQALRDRFGAHGFERTDRDRGETFTGPWH
ncbi:MAG: NADP-dependent phosphogluconate dehydrogenase [Pseudomonadota bacterium]